MKLSSHVNFHLKLQFSVFCDRTAENSADIFMVNVL